MKIKEIIQTLESIAPLNYQESYDNSGLLVGSSEWECTGVLCTLDTLETVVEEALAKNCNLIVAHHPIIFSAIKKLNGENYVERTVIAAIKNNIAIYAIHTNLDNVYMGVNKKIADLLGLTNQKILAPKTNSLSKLITFVPPNELEKVRNALFTAGAGNIGNYTQCSYSSPGTGTFKAKEGAHPVVGNIGERVDAEELKIEFIFPNHLQPSLTTALQRAHPYEEVAYDIIPLSNIYQDIGSGIIGDLAAEADESAFLATLKSIFKTPCIKHTALLGQKLKRIAVCGGAGSFLTKSAIAAKAQIFITSDIKYHEFFDADNQLVLADIGHWESEQYTIDLIFDILVTKFTTFAILKSALGTNPVQYYL
ncbi:Nif3-like dinuclear metal center hexameric protein [Arachidicoccus sp.]|uniref:Nif3-like dinuclear metal center hexameric protein n=1 Tax=Arachidicoccus sp. TaxID=1872624 RepID=UPI003D1B31B6